MTAYNDNGTGTHRQISSCGLPGEQRSAFLGIP